MANKRARAKALAKADDQDDQVDWGSRNKTFVPTPTAMVAAEWHQLQDQRTRPQVREESGTDATLAPASSPVLIGWFISLYSRVPLI
jgi:hypothetical protein